MKKFVFLGLVLVASILLASCVTIEDDGETDVFQEIITFDGISADNLFDKAEKWIAKEFRTESNDSEASSINYKNKEEHSIQATYYDAVQYKWSTGMVLYVIGAERYYVSIDTKDGMVRLSVQLHQVRTMYDWIPAGHKHQEKAKSKETFKRLVSSLSAEINGLNKNNDW